ncbi:hypothetical protein [Streptomyces sp. NPDC057253]|uniref:hypothetical protein n=1 Tax=Streptomyces sp. NPDC057253 TaxID=3346069 RepID=UPI00363B2CDB
MRRSRSRILTVVTALTAVALTAVLVTGCDPDGADNSLDCVSWTDTLADGLRAVHEGDSPETIRKKLDRIGDETNDSKVEKAVKDLDKAVEDYNKAVLNGDTDPDSSRIDAAADRLKDLCTS